MSEKYQVSTLEGRFLDHVVAIALRIDPYLKPLNAYSTEWNLGGPIIDKYAISIYQNEIRDGSGRFGDFYASCCKEVISLSNGLKKSNRETCKSATGDTHLIAAMRAFVMSQLSDEVEITSAGIGGSS